MTNADPSHNWVPFDPDDEADGVFCNDCFICTCCAPHRATTTCVGEQGWLDNNPVVERP